jgi:Flp pilus assembly protein TadG
MKTPVMLNRFVKQGNNRGVAAIYLALLLFAMIGIVALAVDLSYKYVAWTQLQNASDSASLAGVSRLPKFPATTDLTAFNNLSAVRREAWRFAANNTAAKKSVFLIQSSSHTSPPNNINNSNNALGDIVVGYWSKTGGFTPANGVNAINAVKVVSRRKKASAVSNVSIGDNPLPTFFGKVLGQNDMSAEANAIAAATPGATNYILMCSTYGTTDKGLECTSACTYPNICTLSPARVLDKNSGDPYKDSFAWTSLAKQNTPSSYLNDMACGRIFPNDDVCSVPIYTTQGQTSTFKALESAMYDPHFDSGSKDFDANGHVIAWWMIIPLSNRCPPDVQPPPYTVERFALIRLVQVCGSGGGNACAGSNYKATSCPYGGNDKIAIDRYSCMNCAQRNLFIGLKWNLVK